MYAVKHNHVIFSSRWDAMLVGLSFFEQRGRIGHGRIVVGRIDAEPVQLGTRVLDQFKLRWQPPMSK